MAVPIVAGLDLVTLMGVLLLIGLLAVTAYTFEKMADVLDVRILGVHPFAHIATLIRNSVVAGCNAGISALEHVAVDLYHALKWSISEFVDGVKWFVSHTEGALKLLWDESLPALFVAKLKPLIGHIEDSASDITALGRSVGSKIDKLDARLDSSVSAALETADRHMHTAVSFAVNGINDDLKVIRSSIDTAVIRAAQLAEIEANKGIKELRDAEDAAIGALGAIENATQEELQDLMRTLDPTTLLGIAAAVPMLTALVNTLASETGLDRAECRTKVKGICGTNPTDWSWLLGSIGALGLGFSLEMVIRAGQDVLGNLDTWANEDA